MIGNFCCCCLFFARSCASKEKFWLCLGCNYYMYNCYSVRTLYRYVQHRWSAASRFAPIHKIQHPTIRFGIWTVLEIINDFAVAYVVHSSVCPVYLSACSRRFSNHQPPALLLGRSTHLWETLTRIPQRSHNYHSHNSLRTSGSSNHVEAHTRRRKADAFTAFWSSAGCPSQIHCNAASRDKGKRRSYSNEK